MYGRIESTFWTDPDIQGLSDDAKLLFVYLLTGPHRTSMGCYRVPLSYMAEDLFWNRSETVSKGLDNGSGTIDRAKMAVQELVHSGCILYDFSISWLLIPKYLRWNKIKNPNSAKPIQDLFSQVPKLFQYYQHLIQSLKQYGNHFNGEFQELLNSLETVPEPLPQPFPNQEQEQEQEQDIKPSVAPARPAAVEEIFDYWRETMNHPGAKLDDKRHKSIARALKTGYSVGDCKRAITGCSLTPHNMGDNERGQRYDAVDLIFRCADQIDRFIRNAQSPPKPNGGSHGNQARRPTGAEILAESLIESYAGAGPGDDWPEPGT